MYCLFRTKCLSLLGSALGSQTLVRNSDMLKKAPAALATLPPALLHAEHHLLKKSETRGEFITLSGRPVTLVGRNVKCVKPDGRLAGDDLATAPAVCAALARSATAHWPEPVEASIIDYANNVPVTRRSAAAGTAPHSIAIYTVSRPLQGGMAAPATDEHMTQEQVERIMAMMRVYSDCESILSAVDAFIASVKDAAQTRDLAELEPPLNTLILRQCEVAADMLLRSSMFRFTPSDSSGNERAHLVLLLECYITHRLHGPLMAWLSMLYLHQNRTLKETFAALVDMQQADAGIKPKLRCSYTPVLEALWHLPDAKSPLAKLQTLRAASLAIETCVTRHLHAIGTDIDSVELGADDRLNILLYVLVQGAYRYGTGDLILHLQFVDIFGSTMSSRASNELSQKCVEFRVATEYLLTKGREELRRDIDKRRTVLGTPGAPGSLATNPLRRDSQDAVLPAAAGAGAPAALLDAAGGLQGGSDAPPSQAPSVSDLGLHVAAGGSSSPWTGATGSAMGPSTVVVPYSDEDGPTLSTGAGEHSEAASQSGSHEGGSPAHSGSQGGSPHGSASGRRRRSLQRGEVIALGDSSDSESEE